jgi:adenylate kinase family enzyme
MKESKIIIIGDAGRGKTTLAEKLSEKLGIPKYSTDDFFWEVKFSKPRSIEESNEMARLCFENDSWIVEGGTRRMVRIGIPKANRIFYLTHDNFIKQIWVIYKRSRGRENENMISIFKLMFYQFRKKYRFGKHKKLESFEEMLAPYEDKVIRMTSFEEIDEYLKNVTLD